MLLQFAMAPATDELFYLKVPTYCIWILPFSFKFYSFLIQELFYIDVFLKSLEAEESCCYLKDLAQKSARLRYLRAKSNLEAIKKFVH